MTDIHVGICLMACGFATAVLLFVLSYRIQDDPGKSQMFFVAACIVLGTSAWAGLITADAAQRRAEQKASQ